MSQINLIILPGWGGSRETWLDFVNVVGKNFDNVHVIDLPCFGTVPCPTEVWSVDDYAEFVRKEILKLNYTGKTILLGHSFGGQIAVTLLAKERYTVSALILSGAAVIRPKNSLNRIILGTVAKIGKNIFKLPIIEKFDVLAKKILYGVVGSNDYRNSTGVKREIFKKAIRDDRKHLLPLITLPTLVLWGESDKYVPLKYGKKIAELIPGAAMHIVKKGGHGLHINNIIEVELVINEFISHV
ncbi:MAG: alpha/beta hydrolase [bacterium]|nr:alpha/beta hydrolase [bacterium]